MEKGDWLHGRLFASAFAALRRGVKLGYLDGGSLTLSHEC